MPAQYVLCRHGTDRTGTIGIVPAQVWRTRFVPLILRLSPATLRETHTGETMHHRQHDETDQRPQRLLRFVEVSSRTRLSKSEIYRRINAGTFPKSLKLGPRAVAWRESDIDGWIQALSRP